MKEINKNNTFTNIIIILLSVFLFTFIITYSFNSKIYDKELYTELYDETDVYSYFNDTNLVDSKTDELFDFFQSENNLDSEFYTPNEINHLEDVRNIFNFLKIISYILFFLILFGIIYLYYQQNFIYNLCKIIILNFLIGFALILFIFIFPFDSLFDKMHLILFPQGNYSFDPTSNLINLFPIDFFNGFFKVIISTILIKELILISISLISLKYSKKKLLLKKNKKN